MIDTHCHLTEFPPFVLPEILANAEQCGVRRLISVSAAFDDWQKNGLIPSSEIEPGIETYRLRRERGWMYWHQLFNPRQCGRKREHSIC